MAVQQILRLQYLPERTVASPATPVWVDQRSFRVLNAMQEKKYSEKRIGEFSKESGTYEALVAGMVVKKVFSLPRSYNFARQPRKRSG
jgi:hypothetical protein